MRQSCADADVRAKTRLDVAISCSIAATRSGTRSRPLSVFSPRSSNRVNRALRRGCALNSKKSPSRVEPAVADRQSYGRLAPPATTVGADRFFALPGSEGPGAIRVTCAVA